MPWYRVVVAWSLSDSYDIDAEDSVSAVNQALDSIRTEEPFADDYEVVDVVKVSD